MKKLMLVLLVLVLIVAGIFFWKGGHHAIFLVNQLEDWLDKDASDQLVTVEINGLSMAGQTFWMELGDDAVYGLETGGYAVYLRDSVLYMDSGTAYTIPPVDQDMGSIWRLLAGAVLQGRITKSEGFYQIQTDSLTADISEDVQTVSLSGTFTWDGVPVMLCAEIRRIPAQSHPLPQPVTDAMVRAQMVPPMLLTEPLQVMIPALKELMPLHADVKLGVECGILSLSETVALSVSNGKADLERDGLLVSLTLPQELAELSPLTGGLLLLRNGRFSREGDRAMFCVTLPGDVTTELVSAMVPQAGTLGIDFDGCETILSITGERFTAISMTADGSVPFLVTEIPVSFSAEFDIQ